MCAKRLKATSQPRAAKAVRSLSSTMRPRHILALTAFGCTLAASLATSAYEFKRNPWTLVGKPVIVGSHAAYKSSNCYTKPGSVHITQQPRHGRISTRYGYRKIGGGSVIDRCVGLQGRHVIVVYTPAKGYRGTDEVRYQITFPHDSGATTRNYYATIDVLQDRPPRRRSYWQ